MTESGKLSRCFSETIDPATDWKRSNPDVVVYLPREGDHNDGDNEHFLVFPAPMSAELMAVWTQSSREGHGDNHIVFARSEDGENWQDPTWISGTHAGSREPQASWGFPVVSRQGRIYCFYSVAEAGVDGGLSGVMGAHTSDDNGKTWQRQERMITVPSTLADPADLASKETGVSIVWQIPIRDSAGRVITGYTRWDTEMDIGTLFLMRFDNIDEGPDLGGLSVTWLPEDQGISLPRYVQPQGCEEPSIALLPDDRLFVTMRTKTGYIWYSVSSDDGSSWREVEVMRYKDHGEPIKQPLAGCPIYTLSDGRFMLLFHNNDHFARSELYGTEMPARHPDIPLSPIFCYRRPGFIALGEFRSKAHQPLWFSEPKQILDTDGYPIGPKKTDEIATYTSLTHHQGRQVLWYPDRKYYLLGKYVTDEMLTGLSVDQG